MTEKRSELQGKGNGSEGAERFLRQAREILKHTNDQLPNFLLINVLIEQQKFNEARAILEKEVLVADPQSVLALNTLGYLFLSMKDWTSARRTLEVAHALNSTDTGVLLNLAGAHYMLADYASAEATLERCLSVSSRNTQALIMLGKALRAKGLSKEDVGRRVNEHVDKHPDIRAEMDVAWAVLWSDVSEPNQ